MKYNVFYRETKIGLLSIGDDGKYTYVPCKEGIDAVEKTVHLPNVVKEAYHNQEPIVFFAIRIENAKKFGAEQCIERATDDFRFVLEQ